MLMIDVARQTVLDYLGETILLKALILWQQMKLLAVPSVRQLVSSYYMTVAALWAKVVLTVRTIVLRQVTVRHDMHYGLSYFGSVSINRSVMDVALSYVYIV